MNVQKTPCFLNESYILVHGLLCFGSNCFQIINPPIFHAISCTALALRPIPLPTLFFLLRNLFPTCLPFLLFQTWSVLYSTGHVEPQSHYSLAEPSSFLTVTLFLSSTISLSLNVCVITERQRGALRFSEVASVQADITEYDDKGLKQQTFVSQQFWRLGSLISRHQQIWHASWCAYGHLLVIYSQEILSLGSHCFSGQNWHLEMGRTQLLKTFQSSSFAPSCMINGTLCLSLSSWAEGIFSFFFLKSEGTPKHPLCKGFWFVYFFDWLPV